MPIPLPRQLSALNSVTGCMQTGGEEDRGWGGGQRLGRRTEAGEKGRGWGEGQRLGEEGRGWGRRTEAGEKDRGWGGGQRLGRRTEAGEEAKRFVVLLAQTHYTGLYRQVSKYIMLAMLSGFVQYGHNWILGYRKPFIFHSQHRRG